MKTIKFAVLALAAAVCGWACEDAELSPLTGSDDLYVYLAEASSNKLMGDLLLTKERTELPVTIRMNHAADHDVTVRPALFDEDMMTAFNEQVGGAYRCVPTEQVELPDSVVIPAGQVSATFNLLCKKFSLAGEKYVIPYCIASADGAAVAPTSSRYALSLAAEIGEVPCLAFGRGRSDATRLAPCSLNDGGDSGAWNLKLDQFTMEWWVMVERYNVNNQALFWMGSDGCEVYARFGDVDYRSGWSYRYDYLQVKVPGMGQKFDTGDPTEGHGLVAGKWYHFALEFDANDSGLFTLYMDGEPVMNYTTNKPLEHASNLAVYTLNKVDLCDTDTSYRPNPTYMCQIRLWKTKRTQEEIKQYMYVEPRYNDPDLVFYLPMNEGEGEVFHDVTGNGHDGQIGNISNNTHTSAQWAKVRLTSDQWPELVE